ncbi:hypothetical protein RFI_31374, partial [Reticulomyxa filosa]
KKKKKKKKKKKRKELMNGKYGLLKKQNKTTILYCAICTQKHNDEEMKKIEEEKQDDTDSNPEIMQTESQMHNQCSKCMKIIAGKGIQTPNKEGEILLAVYKFYQRTKLTMAISIHFEGVLSF